MLNIIIHILIFTSCFFSGFIFGYVISYFIAKYILNKITEECERIKGGDGDDTQLEHIQHFIKNLK